MKHKSFIFWLTLILTAICLSSCNSYLYYNIHVLNPAEIKLGRNIQKVYILCPLCQNTELEKKPETNQKINEVSSLNFLYSLKENLQNSPIFESTRISLISLDSLLVEMKDIKKRLSSGNIIISLDTIELHDITSSSEKNNNPNAYFLELEGFDMSYIPAIYTKLKCRVLDSKRFANIDSFSRKDTMYFPYQLISQDPPEIYLPPLEDKCWDASIKAAEKYANHLAPYWTVEERTLFDGGNRKFRMATRCILENKPDSSLLLFREILGKKKYSKSLGSKVFHNYAVLLEMTDNFEEAIWAEEQSHSLKKNKQFSGYLDILRHRKVDKIALDWQLE